VASRSLARLSDRTAPAIATPKQDAFHQGKNVKGAVSGAFQVRVVEPGGIEPPTSCMPCKKKHFLIQDLVLQASEFETFFVCMCFPLFAGDRL
jgi:hypothetical protein